MIFKLTDVVHFTVGYPIIPWIAVMSLGYYIGTFYDKTYDSAKRKKVFNLIGFSSIGLFIIIRFINRYGDPIPWQHFDSISKELISFKILQNIRHPYCIY